MPIVGTSSEAPLPIRTALSFGPIIRADALNARQNLPPVFPSKLLLAIPLPRRFKAAGVHLLGSAVLAALAGVAIFLFWFPAPFDAVAGGVELFVLVMSVDVVAGPALTFVAASPDKPRREFRRDLAVIVVVQLFALGYGIHTVSLARPVLLSFEVDRFRVVSAAEIDPASLEDAPVGMRSLSWTGPRQIAAVKPSDPDQLFRSMELGMSGIDLSMDPRNWRPYDSHWEAAWQAGGSIERVIDRSPSVRGAVEKIAADAGLPTKSLRYLPLQSRKASWIVVLAQPGARIVGYLPVDGFF